MTGKERLELIPDGHLPDKPPHWELVFQIEREMFDMDPDIVPEADKPAFQLDVFRRRVDELGWAAAGGGSGSV